MKKTYIQPSTEVHKIETVNLLSGTNPDTQTLNVSKGTATEWGSRGSGWDDED